MIKITKDEALEALSYYASLGALASDDLIELVRFALNTNTANTEKVRQQLVDTEISLVKLQMMKPRTKATTYEFITKKMLPYKGKTYFNAETLFAPKNTKDKA